MVATVPPKNWAALPEDILRAHLRMPVIPDLNTPHPIKPHIKRAYH